MEALRLVSKAVGCAALAGALLAPAAPVSATIIGAALDNGDGTFTYAYQIDNTAGSFDIFAWSLEFDFAPPDWNQLDVLSGGDVEIPNADWFADVGVPVLGLSAQDFLSLVPDGDVLIGSVLRGFSFTSAFQPTVVTYNEFSAGGDSATGSVVGPGAATVPEPGALLTYSVGLALVAFSVRRRS